ncbi:hypothetical protein GCM10011339_29470 [Echinicola rosea]|uniref:Thioredoxin domain-containing protein n=2 Tax=Echinicola rosea TaxID=1807691 RepID=A0ABQ1V4Y6_9BACT|nr:hypothetical protein GCM10011339_29470 [Echinicola rosea]
MISGDLPEKKNPLFRGDTARLDGYIKGYDGSMDFTTGIIYVEDVIEHTSYPVVVTVFPDGRFEGKWPLLFPSYTSMKMGNHWLPIYVEPGKTLTMILDKEDFEEGAKRRDSHYQFKHTQFKGSLAQVNRQLYGFGFEQFNYQRLEDQVKTYTPMEFKERQMAGLQNQRERAKAYIAENDVDPKVASIINNEILTKNAIVLYDFLARRRSLTNRDTSESLQNNEVLNKPVPENYYDFLQEMPLDDKALMVSDEFSKFVYRFEVSQPFKSNNPSFHIPLRQPDKELLLDFLDQKGIELSEMDRKLITISLENEKTKEDSLFLQAHEDSLQLFAQKHGPVLKEFFKRSMKDQQPSKLAYYKAYWNNRDSVLVHQLGLKDSWTYEVTKIRNLEFALGFIGPEEAGEYWESLKAGLNYEELQRKGQQIYDKVVLERESEPYAIEGEGAEIFKEIIAPFKGKVLFVDFWATTCGPCVYAIKKMKGTRQQYKDKGDIEFIFITDQKSSPEKQYQAFINDQEMDYSYILTADKHNLLRQLFKFNGIPRYVVIDREGKVYDDDFAMHNFDTRLPEILVDNP